jgi:acyl-CoA dehydrogenase
MIEEEKMDFSYSQKVEALRTQVRAFMDTHIVPRIRFPLWKR